MVGPESQPGLTLAHVGALRTGSKTAVCNPTPDEFIVRPMVAMWLSKPDAPVTVTLVVPVAAVAEAVRVKVELALLLLGGVTGVVEKPAVTPLGRPEAESAVAALKPFKLVTVMELVPFVPCVMVNAEGRALIV